MEFKVNDRVIAVRNGIDYGQNFGYCYGKSWTGTVNDRKNNDITVSFDNGKVICDCMMENFELAKEEQTMLKPGDTVKVKGCTGETKKFNGETGKYLKTPYPMERYCHTVCFDGTGTSCGWLFADHELEVIPQAPQFVVGDKVTVRDGSWSYEFADGKVSHVSGEINKGIYEITVINTKLPTDTVHNEDGKEVNDTIIRRISDGRVFFVQQRFLKAFVALPKFSVGQIVEAQNNYCRVAKVNDDLTYVITGCVNVYNDGSADIVVDESELSEVDTK